MAKSSTSQGRVSVAFNKQRRTFRRWTKKETAYLRARYPYETAEQIGATLNRTKEEVYNKLKYEREYNKSNPYMFKKKTFPNRKKRSCYSLNPQAPRGNVVPINASVSIEAQPVQTHIQFPTVEVTPVIEESKVETIPVVEEAKTETPIMEEKVVEKTIESIPDVKVEIPEVKEIVKKADRKFETNIMTAMISSLALIISFFSVIIALIK